MVTLGEFKTNNPSPCAELAASAANPIANPVVNASLALGLRDLPREDQTVLF